MKRFYDNNHALYEIIIQYTVSNTVVHSLLILIEYFVCILPYSVSSVHRINCFKQLYTYHFIDKYLSIYSRIKYELIDKNNVYSSPYYFIILSVNVISLALFVVMRIFYKRRNTISIIEKILVNYYNIIYFRYFSFLFLDVNVFAFLSFLVNKSLYDHAFVSVLLLLFLSFYYIIHFLFILNYSIYFRISNHKVLKNPLNYPYDPFSYHYEKLFFIYKMIIAFESNYIYLNNGKVSYITVFFNGLIIVYGIFLFLDIVIPNLFKNVNVIATYTNSTLNNIRKFCLSVNCYIIIISLLFQKVNINYFDIALTILGLLCGFTFCFCVWNYYEKPTILYNPQCIEEELILYVFSNYQEKNNKDNKEQIIELQDIIITNIQTFHLTHCNNKECLACELIKNNDENVFEKLLKIYLITQKKKTFKYYLILLLYHKIQNNIYQFFKNYFVLINESRLKTPIILRNTIIFYVNCQLAKENISTHTFLYDNFNISKFNSKLKKCLDSIKVFINQSIELKTADRVITISKELNFLQEDLIKIINKMDLKVGGSANEGNTYKDKEVSKMIDQNKKNIASVCQYNLTISRFILETLLNTRFVQLNPLNIEILEDYFSYHFQNDKIIILSYNLNYVKNKINKAFTVIKITGYDDNSNTSLCDYFPKTLQKEGIKKLFKEIKYYKNGETGLFEYVILKNNYLEYIKYNFELASTIINNSLILYGHYSLDHDKLIILKNNKIEHNIGNLEILNFSRIIGQLFLLKPSYLEIINKNSTKRVTLKLLFKNIVSQDKTFQEIIDEEEDKKPTSDFCDQFRGEFSYEYLKTNLVPIFDSIQNVFLGEEYEKYQNELNKIKETLKKRQSRHFVLLFTKKMEINQNHCLYSVSFASSGNTFLFKNTRASKQGTFDMNDISNLEEEIVDTDNNNFFKDYNLIQFSNSSVNEQSISDRVSSTLINSTKSEREDNTTKEMIKTETRNLTIMSYISLSLNIILIFICFIFLITQINQTSDLKTVNNLFVNFKTLKADFGKVFSSVLSQICLGPTPLHKTCENPFQEFISDYQHNKLKFEDYDVFDYFLHETKFNINALKELYSLFKRKLYDYKDNNFLAILDSEVVYFSFEQKPGELVLLTETKGFDNAIMTFINSLLIIIDEINEGKSFREVPLKFITLIDKTLLLENIQNQNLNHLQHELYKIFSNFINFSLGFNYGVEIIESRFNHLRNSNNVLTWCFIFLLIGFNLILTMINTKNIQIATTVFKKIICTVFYKFESPEFKEYLLKKIDNLIDLSYLYSKQPSIIIKQITKTQKRLSRQETKKGKEAKKVSQEYDIKQKSQEEQMFIQSINKKSYQMLYFHKEIMFPLYLKNTLFFSVYIIVIAICDIVLVSNFSHVFQYFDYSIANINLYTSIYSDFSLTYVNRLLNITDENLAEILKQKIEEDGIVNFFLRNSLEYYSQVKHLRKKRGYKSIGEYLSTTCQGLYETIEDESILSYHTLNGLTSSDKKYKLQQLACEELHLLLYDEAIFSFEDYFTVLQNIHNKSKSKKYEDMYKLITDHELYSAYLHIVFFFRPILSFYLNKVLTPNILHQFQNYVRYVWIYLILNIIFEIILFVLNKKLIVGELNIIKNDLLLFDKCVS